MDEMLQVKVTNEVGFSPFILEGWGSYCLVEPFTEAIYLELPKGRPTLNRA